MKFFLMSCLVLLLAVCSVDQAEGYNIQAAICTEHCDARFDICSVSNDVSDEDCDDDYFSCMEDC